MRLWRLQAGSQITPRDRFHVGGLLGEGGYRERERERKSQRAEEERKGGGL